MMLSLPELIQRHRLKITGVLHVGAHTGEEAPVYKACGIDRVWWVEANPALLPTLRPAMARYGQKVIEALVDADPEGREVPFHVTGPYAGSSSLLEFGTHPTFSPDVKMVGELMLKTRTINSLAKEHGIVDCNMLVMDLQGAELRALRGAWSFLEQLDVVFTEINSGEVYKGCAKIWELDEYLGNFVRMETYWVKDQEWGDGLWIRRALLDR